MSPESLEALASLGGLLLALVGLPLVYLQLRDVQRSVRGGAHAAIYTQAADFRAHLVQHPHLRRYFFDGAEIGPEHEEYERVLTIADLFLNYLEHISVMADALGTRNQPSLDRFCRKALEGSPILRERLQDGRALFSDALVRRMGDAVGRSEGAR